MLRTLAPIAATTALLAACASAPTVNVDADPAANIAAYRTYSWAFNDTPRGMNPLMYNRVKEAIDSGLAARGYTQASPGDFAVGFTLGSRDKVEVDDFGAYGPYYPGYGVGYRWGWAHPYSNVDVRNVTEGTLTVDVFDTGSKKPVWHGVASKEVNSQVSQEEIDAAVAALLAKFGPGG